MMKSLRAITLATALAAPGGMSAAASPARAGDAVPALFTIVTSADPQTQLMAMVLTMQSIQQGAAARILLCGPAGDIALKQPPDSATRGQAPKGMSPQGLMKKIMETGATVEVCAIYLPNKPATPEALLEGITPAMPDAIATQMLAPSVRILSF